MDEYDREMEIFEQEKRRKFETTLFEAAEAYAEEWFEAEDIYYRVDERLARSYGRMTAFWHFKDLAKKGKMNIREGFFKEKDGKEKWVTQFSLITNHDDDDLDLNNSD